MGLQIRRRLELLRIDDSAREEIQRIRPVVDENLDGIIYRFYQHLMSFPEGRNLFGDKRILENLPARQKSHWQSLFACRFDHDFEERALAIGKAHFRHGVALHLYVAGYNFFHCELIEAITEWSLRNDRGQRLSGALSAVTQVINLDMDLALSVYTRELWRIAEESASATAEKDVIYV